MLVEAFYLLLVRRLSARGRGSRWPVRRTIFFSMGVFVIFVALDGPADHFADLLLSVHMGQHMLLQLVAPPLLLLGAPVTLLLRADPPWPRRPTTLRFIRSKAVGLITHPLAALAAFVTSILVAHFTPLYQAALTNEAVHAGEHLLFLTTGLLFWEQVVESDPLPQRLSPPARLMYLFLVMPVMAVTGEALAQSSTTLYRYYASLPQPWGGLALADQHRAGAMMWEFGIFVIAPVMGRVLMQWLDREERDQKRYELSAIQLEESAR